MEHLVTVGSDGKVLLNYAYAYDGNGNCTKKSGDVYQNAYGYDVMNRLSEATYHGDTEQYTYDLAGNRLTRKTQTGEERYEYNCKNQLTGLEAESDHMVYLYDKQGNLLSEQGKDVSRTYAYDPLNRQYSVTTEKGVASYRYDGEGLRYETEEAGKVIRFVFDRGELAAEESGSEQKRYCRGHHVVSLQSAREDSPHYFVCDEMGSTIFLLNQEQEIRKSYHYDPFGSIIETSGSIENRITYTGQMYDGISGQYYLRARFYNPKIGRFMQEDAYRGDGINLYAYCQNNPITYYDPSGYMGLCPAGKSNPQAGTEDKPDLQYRLKDQDMDWRGTDKTYRDAVDEAFAQIESRTGYTRDQFKVTKWAKDLNGKSIPVEYLGPDKSFVDLDLAHYGVDRNGNWAGGPDTPHVGWQYGTKGKTVGHILVDVPTGRDYTYSDLLEQIYKQVRPTWPKIY
nr:polymorphic toxin type 47 domain-containing protein [Lacrimispora indolis]